jgi:hypothetical protein
VQRAQVDTAARKLADRAAVELPAPWPRLVREAATARESEVADTLDQAVSGADLHVSRPRWWSAAGLVQRLLGVAVLIGLLWLLGLAVLGYLRIDEMIPVPELGGVPVPSILLLGGAGAGVVLAFLTRLVNGAGARRRSRAAARSLRKRVEEAAHELVISPVEAELEARAGLRAAVEAAQRRNR